MCTAMLADWERDLDVENVPNYYCDKCEEYLRKRSNCTHTDCRATPLSLPERQEYLEERIRVQKNVVNLSGRRALRAIKTK